MNDTHYIFNICGVVALLNDLFLVEVWNILIFMRGIRLFLLIVKCWHNTNWFFLERCIFFFTILYFVKGWHNLHKFFVKG